MLHAVIVWLLILNRPGNQVMVLCALFPLFNVSIAWRRRIVLSLVFLFSYGVCHVAYASFNYIRVGEFQVSTAGNMVMPIYRIYLQDALVNPANGPKSRELEQLVEEKILTLDEFQKYRIDSEVFFNMPSQRMFNQLINTVINVYGWDDQWLILRQVSKEALYKHPIEFFLTYIDHVRDVFYVRGSGRFDISRHNRSRVDHDAFLKERYLLYEQLGLPIPTEGDLLPGPKETLINKVQENYTSQTFFNAKKQPVDWKFPNRHCSYHWGEIFDIYGVKFPFTFVFLCVGITGIALSMVKKVLFVHLAMFCIASVSFVNLAVTLMGSVQFPFRFPFDAVFILLGCFGLHGIVSFLGVRQSRVVDL
jgi:hypothetical protein